MRPPSRPPAKAGFTPIPSVSHRIIAFTCASAATPQGLIRLSLRDTPHKGGSCHGYAFPRRSSRAQVVLSKSKFPASRLAPLGSGRPAYLRLFMPRFVERNTNCVKMQTDREIPAATKNHPYGVKSFSPLFSPQITDETARKPARIMRRGFQRRRVHTWAQTASAHVGASCTHTRAASRTASSRHAASSRARPASRQAVKPSPRRAVTKPRRPCATLAHYAPSAQRVTPRMRHATRRALCAHQPKRIMRTHERARGPLRASQVPITNRRQSRARSKCVASARSGMEFAMVARGCGGRGFCERKEWGYYRGVRVWLSRIFWRGGEESFGGAWKNMEIIFCGMGLTRGNGVWYHCAR